MANLTNFELGCLLVALILVLPELTDFVRKLAENSRIDK